MSRLIAARTSETTTRRSTADDPPVVSHGRGSGTVSLISALVARLHPLFQGRTGVMVRYLITSGINVVNHQLLLQTAVRWWDWPGGVANVFAAMIAVVPAYLLSRYWVWQVSGRSSLRAEVVPFWIIAILGLIASTLAADAADRMFAEPLMISVGSLAGYGVVWVLKFLVLGMLFGRARRRQVDEPVAIRADLQGA